MFFFELIQLALGERNSISHNPTEEEWHEVYRLASEQSVLGLVLQGIERLRSAHVNLNLSKELLLQWIGEVQILEQQNKDMNAFIAKLIEKLRKKDVYAILVKGQGVAQCYEKPLWRSCGDVDLLLSSDNYEKAVKELSPLASKVDEENVNRKHLALTIDPWVVELHGTLRTDLWGSVDRLTDEVQKDIFYNGNVRSWLNGQTQVFLPGVDDDVVFVFIHILQHFFVEGIGLRQICDWCRLLYTYREKIDVKKLEARLRSARLMTEWKVFAALVVDYLGMPEDSIPFYEPSECMKRKARRVMRLVLDTGNFGHNRDMSYKQKDSFFVRLAKSFARRNKDAFQQILVFPIDGLRMWWKMIILGVTVAARGE